MLTARLDSCQKRQLLKENATLLQTLDEPQIATKVPLGLQMESPLTFKAPFTLFALFYGLFLGDDSNLKIPALNYAFSLQSTTANDLQE